MDKSFYRKNKLLQSFQFSEELPASILVGAVEYMPIHMHDGLELLYVIEGTVKIKISFNFYELHPGDFLLINTFEVHSIEKISAENLLLFLQLDDIIFDIHERFFAFDPDFYRRYNLEHVESVKKSMAQLYCNWQDDFMTEMQLETIRKLTKTCKQYFLMQNFDSVNKQESPLLDSAVKLDRIGNTFKFFYMEHEQKIQLDKVAEREYIDKFYAAHLIKTGTGSSFQENLNIVRIDRSEVLLLGTDIPIHEVAYSVGFASYQYFSQCFKQFYGMTPFLYRKKYEKEVYPKKEMRVEMDAFTEEFAKSKLTNLFDLPKSVTEEIIFTDARKNKLLEILNAADFFEKGENLSGEGISSVSFKKSNFIKS